MIVTAFPVGSGPDVVLRHVGDKLSKKWSQPVTVVNKPGGAGFVAIEFVRNLPADGHTLLQLDSDHLAALPVLYKSKSFVTLDVFDPVTTLFRNSFLVAVPTNSKIVSMMELIANAKDHPASILYGSWGVGSPAHLGGEYLELLTGTEMVHVPFKEMSQLFASVGNNELNWSFGSIPSSKSMYQAGKIRYIAVASSKRLPQMPLVPTVAESGGPAGFEVDSFVVLVAPRNVPKYVADKIHNDVTSLLREEDTQVMYNLFAYEAVAWGPDEVRKNAKLKMKLFEQLASRKNIRLD